MQSVSGIALHQLRTDGGASENPLLMQFQADLLNQSVVKSNVAELSAIGSAYMGGLGVGLWTSLDEIASLDSTYSTYLPTMNSAKREQYMGGWKQAVASVLAGSMRAGAQQRFVSV